MLAAPPQRPSLEELHRRLSALRGGPTPGPGGDEMGSDLGGRPTDLLPPPSSPPRAAPPPSPFPLLDPFPDPEDVLTVTQCARGGGLAFECLWERCPGEGGDKERGGGTERRPPPRAPPAPLLF